MYFKNVLGHVNQFEFEIENKRIFQSYKSICAVIDNAKITLGCDWDYSRTTLKHLCAFLGVSSKKDIINNIKSGVYVVDSNLR